MICTWENKTAQTLHSDLDVTSLQFLFWQALAVVAIVTVNLVVKLLIQVLSTLERHHTRSSETRSVTGALFTTQVLNFAVSIVVANAYLPRAQVRKHGCRTILSLLCALDLTCHCLTQG